MSWRSRPHSFEPLDSRDAVEGDADAVSALARRYANTAAEIESQVANLRRLSDQARGGWKGKAGEKFAGKAAELADRIGKAQRRYEAAARALDHFAGRLDDVQHQAYAAVRTAQRAEEDRRRLQHRRPAPPGAVATPEQLLAAHQEQRAFDDAVEATQAQVTAAQRQYDRAVSDYQTAARTAARMLRDGRRDDGLKDSWWDKNASWIKTALKVIGAIVVVLAVIALVIALFIPGLNVVILGATFSAVTALNVAGAALTTVMLGGHLALWRTGHGKFSDVVWDLVGLATFGLGFAIAPIARVIGANASRIGQGIAATRGGRAAFSARGLPGRLYDLGRRVPLTRRVLSLSPKLRETFRAGDDLAAAGRRTVAGLSGNPSTMGSRWLAFGDRDLAELTTLVARIDDTVPGSIRISALNALARGTAVGWGWGVQSVVSGQSAYSTFDDLVREPRQEEADQRRRAETVGRWSVATSSVP